MSSNDSNGTEINFCNIIFRSDGKRIGQAIAICYKPEISGEIVGGNEDGSVWLVRIAVPMWLKGCNSIVTEVFLNIVEDAKEERGKGQGNEIQ